MAARRSVKLKDHTILGLDIGSRFIKIAEMRFAKGRILLQKVAMRPTPPGVMDTSQILDPRALGRAVRELVAASKFTTKRALVTVSGQQSVVVRPIDLPKMTRKELVDTMKFEVERHVPFAVDEVMMDYAPMVEPADLPEEETNMKVLLAVAQEELIHAYVKVLNEAGLQPVAMDVEVLSVMRALITPPEPAELAPDPENPLPEPEPPKQTVALVNLGAGITEISIIVGDQLAFTRAVPIAGDSLTEAIADHMGRSHEEAEEIKLLQGCVFLDAPVGELPTPLHDDVPVVETPAEPADTSAAPHNIFSLDDDFDLPGAFAMGGQADAAAPAAAPFSLDEPAAPAAPAFELPAGDASAPLFDLSSELDQQKPPPLARPSFDEPADAPATPFGDGFTPFALEEPESPLPETLSAPAFEASPFEPTHLLDQVPAFERPDAPQHDVFQRRVFEAMLPTLIELVTEIRRSLEYFSGREPDNPVERVVIFGGTSRLPNLAAFMHHELGVPVEVADPLLQVDLLALRDTPETLQELAPALPVAIGLGMRDMLA